MKEGIVLMDMGYGNVLERLREERIGHGMSQGDLGSRIRISQGHYSKAEHAIKRFTYYEVKSLAETELDLYYIYTGRRVSGKYREFFSNCSYNELLCYLNMTASLFACMYEERSLDQNQEFYRHLRCVRYITGAEGSQRDTIFFLIRQFERKTQCRLAEQLGMDVKKYRELERGVTLPDSELIWKLYDMFQVPPAFVLRDFRGIVSEIEYLLSRPEPLKNEVIHRYFTLLQDYYRVRE